MDREAIAPARDPSAVESDFDAFYRREHLRLYRSLLVMTGNRAEAEDVVQEAFVKVFERWTTVCLLEVPRAYLYRTAVNLHRNTLRRAARRARRAIFDRGVEEDFSPAALDRAEVVRVLLRLSRPQREAIVLTDLVGMSSREAAVVLGIPPDAVRARVHRGRARAREELTDDG